MTTVGIRNLKNSLSRYIKMVKEGERVLVTEHDRIVAEIIPASQGSTKKELLERYLAQQAKSGRISLATRKTTLSRERSAHGVRDQAEIEKIYDNTRSDRE